jgi:HEAT repeat protein
VASWALRGSVATTIALAAIATSASCGPRVDMRSAEARAQFSSKPQSMQASADGLGESSSPEGRIQSPPIPSAPATPTPSAPPPTLEASTTRAVPTSASGALTGKAATAPASPPAVDPATVLRTASTNTWAALRAHAVEASIRNPKLLLELAPAALRDENRGVRFVACMAIAESGLTGLVPQITPLLDDPSPSVRAAAMLALHRSGQKVNFTPLATMLQDNDPEIRANAYLVLGEIGNESAIPLIRQSLGRGMKLVNPLRVRLVDLAAAEALVKLGEEFEVEPIRAALFAPPEQAELTVVACDSVRRLRDEVARPMLERVVSAGGNSMRSPEIRLAASRALARLGSGSAPLLVAREYVAHPDARVRAQAAALLGDIGSTEALAILSGMLGDGNPSVQVAAAGGLEASE